MRTKDEVRKEVWKAMEREGVSRFPGAEGRIPNFAGAKLAAEKLADHRLWKRARVIKANPDSPQTHARRIALEEGKTVIMAVPRLRDPHPFRVLDPKKLSKAAVKEAATIKGALKHGRVVALDDLPEIDFVLCGSVAVNLSGARVGKGGGYHDLEYGILADAGKIDGHTTVATTVHPIQILRQHLMVTAHDLPGRPDRDAARGDRSRAPVRAPARHPLGPPAAAADPRDPGAGTDGVCLSRRHVTRRIVAGTDYGNRDPEWLRIDWRQHLHQVELPGAAVNYVEIGEGEPIVFVHGISGCWQNWLENLPHFGRARRAIALDLPGFGASPMPSWEIDMPAYGRLLHDFCEKLGVEGATAGRQLDGRLHRGRGGDAAPGRFERLVLVSAAGIINTWNPEERAVATAWAWKIFGPPLRPAAAAASSPARAPASSSSGPSSATRTGCARTCCWSRSTAGCSGPTASATPCRR